MILADTSAWVEFLRGTGSETNLRLRGLLEDDELSTTDVVLMEVLAGARDDPIATSSGACSPAARSYPPRDLATTRTPRSCTEPAEDAAIPSVP